MGVAGSGPLPDAASIRSKGFTLSGALAYVDQAHGPAARARVIAALDPESQRIAGGTILASEWVPFRTQVALYETIDRTLGAGDLRLCFDIGRFTSENEMSTVNRIFLRLGSLEHWMKLAGLMWGRYYSAGRLEVEGFGKDEGITVLRDFNPISKAFCNDFAGWKQRTAELSGAKNVRITHPDCLLDGAPVCRYVARWNF